MLTYFYNYRFFELYKLVLHNTIHLTYKDIFKKNLVLKEKNIISFHDTCENYNASNFNSIFNSLIENNKDYKFILISDGTVDCNHERCFVIKTKYHNAGMLDINEWSFPQPKKNKTKWFLSLNKRAEYFRQLLFEKILSNNLENFGYLSYLSENRDKDKVIIGCKEKYKEIGIGLNYIEKIPFYNFDQKIVKNNSLIRNYPIDLVNESFFQIVSETYFTPEIFHSEKTLLPLLAGSYPLIIGSKNAMKNLKELGFELPKDLFDYNEFDVSYEGTVQVESLITKLKFVIENCDLQTFSKHWYPYSLYNYDYYRNDFQKKWENEKIQVLDQISKL